MTKKIEYQKRKELNLCLQCGGPERVKGKNNCLKCVAKLAQKYKENRTKRICVNCGSPTVINKTRCDECRNKQKILMQERRDNRAENHLCKRCGNNLIHEKTHCLDCLNKFKKLRDKHKSLGLCQSCGGKTCGKARCEKCITMNKESMYRLKLDVFNAYGGPKCNCCGDLHVEFLALDHMNNDGAEHRRKVTNSGVYRSLRQQGYPPGYQVLCHNCNWAKHAYGICPHQREKLNDFARTV